MTTQLNTQQIHLNFEIYKLLKMVDRRTKKNEASLQELKATKDLRGKEELNCQLYEVG